MSSSGNGKKWKEIATVAAGCIAAVAALIGVIVGGDGIVGLFSGGSSDTNRKTVESNQTSIEDDDTRNSSRNPSTTQVAEATIQRNVAFFCETSRQDSENVFTTQAKSSVRSQPVTIIDWNPKNFYFGEQWTPERRCNVVSERFQNLYNRDGLKYITADIANWVLESDINVICGLKEYGERCDEDDLLFTLQNDDDPNEVLDELIALRQSPKTNKPVRRGEEPVPFSEGRRVYYNILEELEISEPSQTPSDDAPAF